MSFFIYCEDCEEIATAALQRLEGAMEGFVQSDVDLAIELIFVDEEEIRRLNNETRGMDKVTDVLSYPSLEDVKGQALSGKDYPYEIDEEGNLLIGSIAICCQRAKEQAEEFGHSFEREIAFLTVHSMLHLLGYDHVNSEEEDAEMRRRQREILESMGLGVK